MSESGRYRESTPSRPFRGPIKWVEHPQQFIPALLHAIPISLSVLGLFYYWFAIADRYIVFLYGHLGATAFDTITTSRYWMTGLVASGVVMVVYTLANWLLGRLADLRYQDYVYPKGGGPPAWWYVWLLCIPSLVIGIPIITMTLNSPVLRLSNTIACVITTLIGLALALMPGSYAAQQPSDLSWLVFDGMGLMPTLLLLRVVELPRRGLANSPPAYLVAFGGTFVGLAWLGIITGLRSWRHRSMPDVSTLFISGICLSYLLMPLAHHLLATPRGYHYISTSSNFFAFNSGIQILVFIVAAILAIGITRLRHRQL